MNHDGVFWGVVIAVPASALVVGWLLFMLYRNATKSNDKQ
jgi:hypothetical protein